MKTKFYLLAIFLCCSIGISLQAQAQKGNGSSGGVLINKSVSPMTVPITVFITDGEKIEVYFNSNIGLVDVVVKDVDGLMVYKQRVNTIQANKLNIDISNLPVNSYLMTFTDQKGNTLKSSNFLID